MRHARPGTLEQRGEGVERTRGLAADPALGDAPVLHAEGPGQVHEVSGDDGRGEGERRGGGRLPGRRRGEDGGDEGEAGKREHEHAHGGTFDASSV